LTIKLTPFTEFVRHYQTGLTPVSCLDAIASAPLPAVSRRQVNLLHLHWIVHSNVMPVRYSIVKDRFCETNRIPFSDTWPNYGHG